MTLLTRWQPLALLLLLALVAESAHAQSYTASAGTANFIDIAATGTPGPTGDDNAGSLVTLPFAFPFFGTNQTTLGFNTNGLITFGATSTSLGNTTFPNSATPNNLLAVYWDDLSVAGTGAQTDYQFIDDANDANDRFIIQWTSVTNFSTPAGLFTFQAQLYRDGRIEYQYGTMTNEGTSFSVGLENSTGTIGTQVYANPATAPVLDNTAILFTYVPPTSPVFAVSNTGTAFNTATACSAASGAENTFTVSNNGVGTLTVTSVTLTGTGAAQYVIDGPTSFALGANQSRAFIVRFAPAVGATAGSAPANVVITYSNGTTTSTSTTAITGTVGTAANTSFGMGEGYTYGTSNAACGAAPSAFMAVPFGPAAGDTEIAGANDFSPATTGQTFSPRDEGNFRIDLAAAGFGTFKFFSEPYRELWVNTNGNILFDGPNASSNATPTPSPTGTGSTARNAVISAAGLDLDLAASGQVFYRAQDITGPGGTPDGVAEFIITYYRVPRFNSTGYATFQVILGQPTTPGGNGIVAIQYYSGINPADGLPFTSAPTPTATSGFASARVALYGDQGFMSTVYRTSGGAGGPAFGAGNLTVFFGPRGEQVLGQTYDGAGWRQLTHGPGSAMDVADLAEQNLVQGITNEYPTATAGTNGSNDNLFTEYDFANAATATDPAGFRPPAARATALTGGKGLFWYFYDSEFDPTGSQATNGTGSSESFTLPNPLLTAGTRRTANVTTTIDATTDGAFRFEMLGNPFEGNFDMTTLTGTGGTPSTVAQTYSPTSPTTGTYVLSSTVGNRVALWQGFFLDVGTGTTAVTFPIAGVTTTATPFQGFGAPAPEAVAATTENRLVAFELSGQTPDGTPTVDQAAAVYFSDAASEAWDRFDAGKLAPFGPYAVLAIQGERDGQAVLKSQESRAYNAASFEVPLVVEAAGTEPALTLRWNQIENVPAEWALTLRDLVTGDVVNLRTATEYTFEVAAVASAATSASVLLPPTPTVLGVDAGRGTDVARFVLHVETAAVTATEDGAPAEFALAAPAPNPTAGAAVVSFDVPEASAVSVAVYDLLGRRVAVLAEGEMAAGRHTSRLEAGTLAPGVYVVRMQAGTFSAVRRVTVVR